MEQCATIVIGGGAAGLAYAAFAENTLVLERLPSPGRKILVTGGGRCNLAHIGTPREIAEAFGPKEHIRFVRPALGAFAVSEQCKWFESLGVKLKVEEGGFVFPQCDDASAVRDALLRAVAKAGSKIRCGKCVRDIRRNSDGTFAVACTDGSNYGAAKIVIAAGGSARPGLGTDGAAIRLAEKLDIETDEALPAIGAIIGSFAGESGSRFRQLAGLSFGDAIIRFDKKESRGGLLITHNGISGPAALNICADIADGTAKALRIAWRADRTVCEEWIALFRSWRTARGKALVKNLLAEELPRALAEVLCEEAGLGGATAARITAGQTRRLAENCAAQIFSAEGTDGFGACMATRGGISVKALDPKTMEARRVPGVYVIGEACAPVGKCGGYNLSWAWASAAMAAGR